MRVLLAATVFVLFLGACGIKGPLFLPHAKPVPTEATDDSDADEQPGSEVADHPE